MYIIYIDNKFKMFMYHEQMWAPQCLHALNIIFACIKANFSHAGVGNYILLHN